MKGKGCLIVVVIVLAIIVLAALVFYFNRGKIADWFVDKMVESVMANLPEDYDQAMAQQTFDEFVIAVKENRVDKEELKEIGDILQAIMADKKLETEEVDQLMEALQTSSQ